jgi:membrane fusion protein
LDSEATTGDEDDRSDEAPSAFRPEALNLTRHGAVFAFAVPTWRALALLASAAVAMIAGFGLFARFDRVASVRGIVIPASGVSRLVAPQAGIVNSVTVRQGDTVARGAQIVRIAAASTLPRGNTPPEQMLETYRRQRELAREERNAERISETADRAATEHEIAQQEAARAAFQQQIQLQHQRIAVNERRLRNLEPLRQRGYVSDLTYQAQQEALMSLRQQLADLETRKMEADHEAARARLRLLRAAATAREGELRADAADLQLERGAVGAQAQAEIVITAPARGEIGVLRASRGMIVAAGEELATLIRPGDTREILLLVPSQAAGFLRVGQTVRLDFDAFPALRYGAGRAQLITIASTATRERLSGGDPVYRVTARIRSLPPGLSAGGLRSDMTLSAQIVLERRTLIDWVLSPLRESWRDFTALGNR